MKRYIIFAVIVCVVTPAFAQQDIILTNFRNNTLFFNPAFAGSNGYKQGSFFANYRDQWMGFEGSPKTQLIGGEYNLMDDKVGLGASLSRESIGVDNRYDLVANYAYRLKIDEDQQLAIGIRAGYHLFNSQLNDINYADLQDPIYDQGNISFNVFSVGTGLNYTNKQSFIGLSVPAIAAVNSQGAAYKTRHLYGYMGTSFYINDYSNFRIDPALLIKYEPAAPVQYTVMCNVWILPEFALGVLYRSQDAIALSAQLLLNQRFQVGLSYDFSTSELRKENVGGLEIMLAYMINQDDNDPFRRK